MTLEQFEIMIEVAKTHSMSNAADNLNMSKTNVSKAIRNLENDCGSQLFFKSRQGSFLTPTGEAIIEHIQNCLEEVRQIKKRCIQPKEALNISIAFNEAFSFLIPDIDFYLHHYYQRTPHIQLFSLEPGYMRQILKNATFDMIFTSVLSMDFASLQSLTNDYFIYSFYNEPISFACKKESFTENSESISVNQMKKFTILILSNISDTSAIACPSIFDNFIKKYQLDRDTSIVSCNSFALLNNYLSKDGYGLLCDRFAFQHCFPLEQKKYQILTIRPETFATRIVMIRKQSKCLNAFSEILSILQNKFGNEFPYFIQYQGSEKLPLSSTVQNSQIKTNY